MPPVKNSQQITSRILMVRPASFGYNPETAPDNAFQVPPNEQQHSIQQAAVKEFNSFVQLLKFHDIEVTVFDDIESLKTTDAIFPNNWISFHSNGTICLFPMFAENRRRERRQEILDEINKNFQIDKIVDLSKYENEGKYLEGTGSLILDRINRRAYLCLSKRTDIDIFQIFCEQTNEISFDDSVIFEAFDNHGRAIYHTNVMMCIGEDFAIICLESIKNELEKHNVVSSLRQTGKTIIEISMEQVCNFAGNMLQVKNKNGDKFLVMSTRAFNSLTKEQITKIESFNQRILHADLTTIENNGGGSARCMMAEIFLQYQAFV